jgi:hypothetical protein
VTERSRRILLLALPVAAVLILILILFPGRPGEGLLIGQQREVPSRILGTPREVNVHLPEHYDASEAGYPVLIKLFGGPWEYFAGLVGEIESLSGFGDIPPLIVVGLDQRGHEEVLPRATGGKNSCRGWNGSIAPTVSTSCWGPTIAVSSGSGPG